MCMRFPRAALSLSDGLCSFKGFATVNLWRPFRLLRLAAVLSLAMGAAGQGRGVQSAQESDLRAALVIGFARFTEWPVTRDGPLVIGVVGSPEMTTALERVANQKLVNGRAVVIRQWKPGSPVAGCQILYFGRLPAAHLGEALAEVRGPVLTMGEEARFLSAGGAVYLFEEDGRMSFEVNLRALQLANVNISSKLLRLGYTSGAKRSGKSQR
jgi:hypothetical protein